MIPNFSFPEIIVICVIALLLFGRRLPEVGRSLGKGIVEFKKGLKGVEEEVSVPSDEPVANQSLPGRPSAYRAPLAEGTDRRVSRAEMVEEAEVKPGTNNA